MPLKPFSARRLGVVLITGAASALLVSIAWRDQRPVAIADHVGTSPRFKAAATAALPSSPPESAENGTVGAPGSSAAPMKTLALAPVRGFAAMPVFASRYGVPTAADTVLSVAALDETATATAINALVEGARVSLPFWDGRAVTGVVNRVATDARGQRRVAGSLDGGGGFMLSSGPLGLGARILPAGEPTATVVSTAKDGRAYATRKPIQAVYCVAMPTRAQANAATSTGVDGGGVVSAIQPVFNSRPTAIATAYLDFDGEVVNGADWNNGQTISAASSSLSDSQIEEVWRRVAEDYRAFNINVTTDPARYAAAPVGSRMRCIITTTTSFTRPSGGVAFVSSWSEATTPSFEADVPCWVFPNQAGNDAKSVAEAVSHEIGHTLGLSHDGLKNSSGVTTDEYYDGHGSGSTSWAPIMGVSYYRPLTQWSRGEYMSGGDVANNQEDDLAIISAAANNTRYLPDAVADTSTEAGILIPSTSGVVDLTGLIERTDDADRYAFATGAGTISLSLRVVAEDSGVSGIANLDASLELQNQAGSVVATSNPVGSTQPSLTTTLAAGTYFVRVKGVGEGSVTGTGYSSYGSIGRYRLTGTLIPTATLAPTVVGAGEATVVANQAFTYPVSATATPTSYAAVGLPSGLTINPATGVISGTATTIGVFPVTLSATNSAGTALRTLALSVVSGGFGGALGAPELTWTTGGDLPWEIDTTTFFDGKVAARSGAIPTYNKESWIQTTVTGPGSLTFQWKVSSEENTGPTPNPVTSPYDRLEFAIDGVAQVADTATQKKFISGEVDWKQQTYVIPSGSHTLRWSYKKDPYTAEGQDAGWLDAVSYVATSQPPAITSALSAVATAGTAFSFQVTATNAPTTFSAENLPPGVALDSSGLINGTPTTAGIFPVALSVANASGTDAKTLTLTVRTAFASWASGAGLTGANAAPSANPDGDAFPNQLEYALALSPSATDNAGGPVVTTVNVGDATRLEVTFTRPPGRPELSYIVEVSDDLTTWQAGHRYGAGAVNGSGLPTTEIERTSLAGGGERIRVRDNTAAGTVGAKRFLRVRVEAP